jgi:ribosomal protein L20
MVGYKNRTEKRRDYRIILIRTINERMREHKLTSSDFIRIVYECVSNDDLEAIRNKIPLWKVIKETE